MDALPYNWKPSYVSALIFYFAVYWIVSWALIKYKMDEKLNMKQASQQDEPVAESTYIKPQARKLHDPQVAFEEYYYYAKKTRNEEDQLEAPKLEWRELLSRKAAPHEAGGDQVKPDTKLNLTNRENRLHVSDEEWTNASRSFRTASAGAIFYLVCLQSIFLLQKLI